MKTAISLPDGLFEAADRLAKRLGLSRSQLYARAVNRFVQEHEDDDVTKALDAIYATEGSSLDPILARIQGAALDPEEW